MSIAAATAPALGQCNVNGIRIPRCTRFIDSAQGMVCVRCGRPKG